MKYKKLILPWSVTFIWMYVIFMFSAQHAVESAELSSGLTQNFINFFTSLLGIEVEWEKIFQWSKQFDGIVRKSGHVVEYLILGILVTNAFYCSVQNKSKIFKYSLLFCVAYSVTDEIHQIFIPGRACRVIDIFIDTIGILIGVMLITRKKRWH